MEEGECKAVGCPLSAVKKVLKIDGAFAPRVLKFDSGCAAEGCGIALSGDEFYSQRYGICCPADWYSLGKS